MPLRARSSLTQTSRSHSFLPLSQQHLSLPTLRNCAAEEPATKSGLRLFIKVCEISGSHARIGEGGRQAARGQLVNHCPFFESMDEWTRVAGREMGRGKNAEYSSTCYLTVKFAFGFQVGKLHSSWFSPRPQWFCCSVAFLRPFSSSLSSVSGLAVV